MTKELNEIIEDSIIVMREKNRAPKLMSYEEFNMCYLPKAERDAMFKIY